jgi:hypothetical protein
MHAGPSLATRVSHDQLKCEMAVLKRAALSRPARRIASKSALSIAAAAAGQSPVSKQTAASAPTSGSGARFDANTGQPRACASTLAIGAKYDSDHHARVKRAEQDRSALSRPMAYAPTVASGPSPAASIDAPGALLARAHACAAVARWDCVIEATSGVIARQGNTQETRAPLAQAMINEGWGPGKAPADQTQNIRRVSTTPPVAKRVTRHWHRHPVRPPLLWYATTTHSDFPSYMPDIYRH